MTAQTFARTVRAVERELRRAGVPLPASPRVSGVIDDSLRRARELIASARAWYSRRVARTNAVMREQVARQVTRLGVAAEQLAQSAAESRVVQAARGIAWEAWMLSAGPLVVGLLLYLWSSA